MAERPVHTPVTYVFIALNLAMFGLELVKGVHAIDPTPQQLIDVGANYAPLTVNGQWWRLGIAMFLHFGLLHIAFNMVCLWQGRVVETLFGRAPFVVLYLLSGAVGGVATMARDTPVVSAGASGAVFGVYGAFGAYLVLRRATMPVDVWQRTARGLGMFLAINFIFGLTAPNIDMSAHIGGLVIGFAIGLALLARTTGLPSPGRTITVAGVVIALAVASTFVIPHPEDPAPMLALQPALARFDRLQDAFADKAKDFDRLGETQPDDAKRADELERDFVAPCRAIRRELGAARPPSTHPVWFRAVQDYVAARQESWEMLIEALRATGDKQAKLELYHVQTLAVQRAATTVENASDRPR